MYKKEYRPRFVDKMVEDYLETFGAVVIEGPKWCGKTWTSSMHSPGTDCHTSRRRGVAPVNTVAGEISDKCLF